MAVAGVVSLPAAMAMYPVSYSPWGLYNSARLLALRYG